MKKVFTNSYIFIDGEFQKLDFIVEDGKFSEFGRFGVGINLNGCKVIPGLYDIHTHGGDGISFDNVKEEQFDIISKYYLSNGATNVLATTTTIDESLLKKQLYILANLCKKYPIFKGIHMEGPFLSYEYKGGMNELFLQKPFIDKLIEYQKIACGFIKIITVSPELDNMDEFIKQATKMGIVVSLGHSGATYEQTNKAIDSGAKSFTHLFNAMKPITHKAEGSILVSALESNNFVEIISDGNHVNKDLFKLLVKCKGLNKIIGISDSLEYAGLPDGEYVSSDGRPLYKSGLDLFYTKTNVRAGSTIGIYDCLKNFSSFTNINFKDCIQIFTVNPSLLLNDLGGKIEVGRFADFIVLQNDDILQVYFHGEKQLEG